MSWWFISEGLEICLFCPPKWEVTLVVTLVVSVVTWVHQPLPFRLSEAISPDYPVPANWPDSVFVHWTHRWAGPGNTGMNWTDRWDGDVRLASKWLRLASNGINLGLYSILSVSIHFGEMYRNMILKSRGYLPFCANLTYFVLKSDSPAL